MAKLDWEEERGAIDEAGVAEGQERASSIRACSAVSTTAGSATAASGEHATVNRPRYRAPSEPALQSAVYSRIAPERPAGPEGDMSASISPADGVQPSDQQLVRQAQAGSSIAYGELVRRHQRRIYRVALHLVKDSSEAEDITQDAFVRAHSALAAFDGRCQPYTWFYRIAVNLALNRLRATKRRGVTSRADDPRLESLLIDDRPSATPGAAPGRSELAASLCEAIDALSETLRTTLILVTIDGLPHGEVANIVGCPEGTVAWRVHEARKKIRVFLAQRGYSCEGNQS